jgi:hypothetical protein
MSYTVTHIYGFGGNFAFTGFNAKWSSWNATMSHNLAPTTGFADPGVVTSVPTIKSFMGSAAGVALDSSSNVIAGNFGSVTLPTGFNISVSDWTANLNIGVGNVTEFSSNGWAEFVPTYSSLSGTLTGVGLIAGNFAPGTMFASDDTYTVSGQLILQLTTSLTITVNVNFSNLHWSRPTTDRMLLSANWVSDGPFSYVLGSNSILPATLENASTGFARDLSVVAFTLTAASGETYTGTGIPTQITMIRNVNLGAAMAVGLNFVATGPVVQS